MQFRDDFGSEPTFVAHVQQVLRQSNLKVTSPRILVAGCLSAAIRPIGAYAIHQHILEKGGKIDVVTVYRTLEIFQELGLIHYIHQAGGFAPCDTIHGHSGHTEHAICESCGKVMELTVPLCASDDFLKQLDEIEFSLSEVKIELLGICKACMAKRQRA